MAHPAGGPPSWPALASDTQHHPFELDDGRHGAGAGGPRAHLSSSAAPSAVAPEAVGWPDVFGQHQQQLAFQTHQQQQHALYQPYPAHHQQHQHQQPHALGQAPADPTSYASVSAAYRPNYGGYPDAPSQQQQPYLSHAAAHHHHHHYQPYAPQQHFHTPYHPYPAPGPNAAAAAVDDNALAAQACALERQIELEHRRARVAELELQRFQGGGGGRFGDDGRGRQGGGGPVQPTGLVGAGGPGGGPIRPPGGGGGDPHLLHSHAQTHWAHAPPPSLASRSPAGALPLVSLANAGVGSGGGGQAQLPPASSTTGWPLFAPAGGGSDMNGLLATMRTMTGSGGPAAPAPSLSPDGVPWLSVGAAVAEFDWPPPPTATTASSSSSAAPWGTAHGVELTASGLPAPASPLAPPPPPPPTAPSSKHARTTAPAPSASGRKASRTDAVGRPSTAASSSRTAATNVSSGPSQSRGSTSSTAPTTTAPTAAAAAARPKRHLLPGTHIASCSTCSTPIAHLQLRGDASAFSTAWEGSWACRACLELAGESQTVASLAQAASALAAGRKKRSRETADAAGGVVVCDVCFHPRGAGGISAVDGKSSIDFAVEFICIACSEKYQRCTDCGGGGGRVGNGKWRCKELFLPGRRTCMLSHARMSAAPMDLGVWKLDDIGRSAARDDFVRLCEELWKEKTFTRLAIPEILEANDGSLRTFADIRADLEQGWPIKERLFADTGSRSTDIVQPFLGLTWCKKTKSRKSSADGDDADDDADGRQGPLEQTFLSSAEAPRMRKINHLGVIPAGYELGGILFGYWKKLTGTLLLTTFLPFEATNGDDRTFLTVGEIAAQIIPEIDAINSARTLAHRQGLYARAPPPPLLPHLAHLWLICDNTDPVILERMRDMLTRRRQFFPLEQYLEQHPAVDRSLFAPDLSYVPADRENSWIQKQTTNALQSDCIMVRSLGPRLDLKKLEEIFTAEFAKSAKPRKKSTATAA